MTITHSAKKIIKNQRFIFRALPALLVGLLILTACGGAAFLNALEQQQNDLQQQANNISDSFDDLDDLDDNDNGNGNGNDNGNDNDNDDSKPTPVVTPTPTPTPTPDPNVDQDPNKVTYSDWLRSTGAPRRADSSDIRNQFLAVEPNWHAHFGRGFTNPSNGIPRFEGLSIGSDRADSFDFYKTPVYNRQDLDFSEVHYAWIAPDTDLGAPLTQTSGTLKWNGHFLSTDSAEDTSDFTLTITFGEGSKFGTIGGYQFASSDGDAHTHITVTGEFDASGIIDGTVARAVFTDGDRNAMVAGTNTPGTLSGLIGAEGAIGIFYGNSGRDSYSGGFIVNPKAKRQVRGGDWLASFDRSPFSIAVLDNGFLFSDEGVGELNFSNATYNGILLGGLSTNGVTIKEKWDGSPEGSLYTVTIPVGGGNAFYTAPEDYRKPDLGPVIDETSGTAIWGGQFQALHGREGSTDTDFTLNINYSDDSLWAFVKRTDTTTPNHYYHIEGNYNEDGVITGTVDRGLFTDGERTTPTTGTRAPGVLTGIIGQFGAIGGFLSGTATDDGSTTTDGRGDEGYAGGFVASPNAIICATNIFDTRCPVRENQAAIKVFCAANIGYQGCPDDDVNKVTYSDWVRVNKHDASVNTGTPRSQFLQIAEKTISTGDAKANDDGTGDPIPATLDFSDITYDSVSLGLDGDNGLAYFTGFIGGTGYSYAGIFGTTDLGAPIADSGLSAIWAGKLRVANVVRDFDLTVTFAGTAGTADAFIVDVNGSKDFLIDGEFDANGLITGDTHYAEFANDLSTATASRNGTLSGIIGQKGAVGVFYGRVRIPILAGLSPRHLLSRQ